MLDTTPVTSAITRLISTGTTEQALLAAVAHLRGNGGGSDRTRRRDCSFGSSHQLAWEPGNRALARCRRSTRRAQECVPWRNSLSPMPTALGVPLFERHRDGIRLTAAWWQFLACIERRESAYGTDRPSVAAAVVGPGILHTTDQAWRSKRPGANGRPCNRADYFGVAGRLSVVAGPADSGALSEEPAPPLSAVMAQGSSSDGSTHEQIAGDLAAHLGHVILTDPGLHQVGDEKLKPVCGARVASLTEIGR